jgi:hypothetical protein
VDAKGYDPGVELASSQHNHLLDEDAIAVVYSTPRPVPSARMSKLGKKE